MSQAQQIEYYYQALGYKRLWLKFRDCVDQHPQAYRHAVLYYQLYKHAVERAGI